MHKSYPLPFHHQKCSFPNNFFIPADHFIFPLKMRKIFTDCPVYQLLQVLEIIPGGKDLEMPESKKCRCYTSHYGTGFVLRISVVEHIAQNFLPGGNKT